MTNNEPVDLSGEELESAIENESALVVDFWAEWCAPCKTIEPIMEDLAEEYEEVFFGKVNVENQRETAVDYDVSSIPTILFIKNGEVVDRVIGALPKDEIEEKIKGIK